MLGSKVPIRAGVTEDRVIEIVFELSEGAGFDPPEGSYKVTNIYVNPVTGKLHVEYEDIPV